VPISLHNKGSLIKLTIATAKGKKVADKRNTLKEKVDRRDMDREIKAIR
jgi:tmRNA-binding protein